MQEIKIKINHYFYYYIIVLKECINGTWNACWILLQKRTLIYTRGNELVEVDLRKARNVGKY